MKLRAKTKGHGRFEQYSKYAHDDIIVFQAHYNADGELIVGGIMVNGETECISAERADLARVIDLIAGAAEMKDLIIPIYCENWMMFFKLYETLEGFENIVEDFQGCPDAERLLFSNATEDEKATYGLEIRSLSELCKLQNDAKEDLRVNRTSYFIYQTDWEQLCAGMQDELQTVNRFLVQMASNVGGINNFRLGAGHVGCRFVENILEKDELKRLVDHAQKQLRAFCNYHTYVCIADKAMKFSANCLIGVLRENEAVPDVMSFDFDSSFWAQVGMRELPCSKGTALQKRRYEHREIPANKLFLALMHQKGMKVKKNCVDWFLPDNEVKPDKIYVSSVLFDNLLQDYEIDSYSFEDVIVFDKAYFPNDVFEMVYLKMHELKSALKSEQDEDSLFTYHLMKLCGNVLHGVAQKKTRIKDTFGNILLEDGTERPMTVHEKILAAKEYYEASIAWFKSKSTPADFILTPQQSVFVYHYAADSLLMLLRMFKKKDIVYYDTDCVKTTAPNAQEIIEKYNKKVLRMYEKAGRDVERITAEKHILGLAEFEKHYSHFYALAEKFYLFTMKDSPEVLHSVTAGFRKDSIAKELMKYFNTTAEETLKRFIEEEDLSFNTDYILDSKGNTVQGFFSKELFSKWVKHQKLLRATLT